MGRTMSQVAETYEIRKKIVKMHVDTYIYLHLHSHLQEQNR
jgi:hypothetical protein